MAAHELFHPESFQLLEKVGNKTTTPFPKKKNTKQTAGSFTAGLLAKIGYNLVRSY